MKQVFEVIGEVRGHKKVADDVIIAAYKETGNVWKTAKKVGLCGQSVHERLVKLGIELNSNPFTEQDMDRLRREYLIFRDAGKIADLAALMGRTKQFICRKAKEIGLTDQRHKRYYQSVWKYMSEDAARVILEDFRHAKGIMREYCARKDYDELGFSRTLQGFFPDEWDAIIEAKTPKQTMYRLGRALEYRCRDFFKARGYFVLRSPRSGGKVDVVAIRTGEVLFIQCKRGGSLGVKEWNDVFEISKSVGAMPIMAMVNPCGKGIDLYELKALKDGSKKRQPMELWLCDVGI